MKTVYLLKQTGFPDVTGKAIASSGTKGFSTLERVGDTVVLDARDGRRVEVKVVKACRVFNTKDGVVELLADRNAVDVASIARINGFVFTEGVSDADLVYPARMPAEDDEDEADDN